MKDGIWLTVRIAFVIFILTGIVICSGNRIACAEAMELIKDGKIVAGATALWNEDDPAEIKDRLYRLSILINQSLIGISGDELTYEKFENFKNRIRVRIADKVNREVYSLWFFKTDNGKELRIAGNNIDNVERAVCYFLRKYLNLKEDEVKSLEEFIDKAMQQQKNLSQEKISEPSFKKVNNLVFEQTKMETRSPSPRVLK